MTTPTPRGLVQAPVRPMDADGIQVAWVGTAVWVLAALWVRLTDAPQWWWWTCLSGVGLGVAGLAYCLWRRQRRGRAEAADVTPDDPSPAPVSAGARSGSVESGSVEQH